ncbi:retrovirus-related Pol polyprotein from transposon TNT 1-94 [Trichonephila clavata]|uniref:Retrovirus-related Pol polyprotein from transposon TNT 1-94 n=1 Tax=Trichonephila clavata TaxID=2740835 RepID=A0A8X6M6F5_TRICU|nr:retrovirus-related Pol polyprotein from transposon TNT 1-94 [Trichonephila clavata]
MEFKAHIEKLVGAANWSKWKRQIELLLRHHDVHDVVCGDRECPRLPAEASAEAIAAYEKARKAFVKDDSVAQLILVGNMDDSNAELTSVCNTANSVGEKLLSVYEQSSGQRLDRLMEKFFRSEKELEDDIATHIAKLQRNFSELNDELRRVAKTTLPDFLLMSRIMSTLPSEYFEFKSVWESVPIEERSVNKLTERLRLIEIRLPSKSTDSTALVATRKKVFKKPERKCYVCRKPGHLAKDCWKKGSKPKVEGDAFVCTVEGVTESESSKDECSLLRDDRARLKGVRTVHGLYALQMLVLYPKVCAAAEVSVASADLSLQLWHERLCHQNKAHVKDILRKYQIKGDAKDSQICDGCCYGTQSRRPFGTKKQRATTPGELINIDVCGPMQQQSLGGAKYYVCFKDDFTKYRPVFFMQSKNEFSKCLETFLNEAKNTGHMVKEVLSDSGGEVINSTVKSVLEKSGISSHMEIVKKPLQTPEADVEKEMEEISCNAEDTEETLFQQSSRNLRDRSILKMPAIFDSFVPEHIEPETYKEAMASEDSDKWLDAMKEEQESLSNNNTWILVNLPSDRKAIVSTPIEKGAITTDNSVSLSLFRLMYPTEKLWVVLSSWLLSPSPDIAYAVGVLFQVLDKPQQIYWTMVKRILRDLNGTKKCGIMYLGVTSATLESYSDSDYAGDPLTRRSTSGMVFKYNGGAIAWRSQRQNCIALSTTEAEFIAASQAAKDAIWLNNLLKELCCVTFVPSLQMDNQSAIRLVKNPEFHNRTKHIDIRYKFIREQYENKQLNVINCSSEVQAADKLTKPLAKDRFLKLKLMLGMYNFGN